MSKKKDKGERNILIKGIYMPIEKICLREDAEVSSLLTLLQG